LLTIPTCCCYIPLLRPSFEASSACLLLWSFPSHQSRRYNNLELDEFRFEIELQSRRPSFSSSRFSPVLFEFQGERITGDAKEVEVEVMGKELIRSVCRERDAE
jgi:hypothetical protein